MLTMRMQSQMRCRCVWYMQYQRDDVNDCATEGKCEQKWLGQYEKKGPKQL